MKVQASLFNATIIVIGYQVKLSILPGRVLRLSVIIMLSLWLLQRLLESLVPSELRGGTLHVILVLIQHL